MILLALWDFFIYKLKIWYGANLSSINTMLNKAECEESEFAIRQGMSMSVSSRNVKCRNDQRFTEDYSGTCSHQIMRCPFISPHQGGSNGRQATHRDHLDPSFLQTDFLLQQHLQILDWLYATGIVALSAPLEKACQLQNIIEDIWA